MRCIRHKSRKQSPILAENPETRVRDLFLLDDAEILAGKQTHLTTGLTRQEGIVLANRSCILILWLAATSAAAAPLAGSGNEQRSTIEHSTTPSERTIHAQEKAASLEGSEDTLTRRLRRIVDELKRAGPPPIGCMEG